MGVADKIGIVILIVTVAIVVQKSSEWTKEVKLPEIDNEAYWGNQAIAEYKEDETIRIFNISYPDEVIDDLKEKLDNSGPFQLSLDDVAFNYGFNTLEIMKVVKYWKDTYLNKWRTREAYLNKFKHYRTQIQGLKVHFIREKPKNVPENVKVVPILLIHGWPGSIVEFYKIIPLLTKKSPDVDYVFEVIAPSIPGYGFSQAAARSGLGTVEIAVIFRNLMLRLGHEQFFIQGGDWGSVIGSNIATIYPENVLGYHSNMCNQVGGFAGLTKSIFASYLKKKFADRRYTDWFFPLKKVGKFLMIEGGYFHLQATKPDTIGVALSQNPVGLAAYILEKFSTWTDPEFKNLTDGGLYKYFTRDELLDNVMVYYLTNSITSSVRLYYEAFSDRELGYEMDRIPVRRVPVGCSRFKHEFMHVVDWVLRDKFPKLIFTSFHEEGGHFAAFQMPQVLYNDIIEFTKKVKV